MTTTTDTPKKPKNEIKMKRPTGPKPDAATQAVVNVLNDAKPLSRAQARIQNILKDTIPKPPTELLKYDGLEYFAKRLNFPELQAIFCVAMIKSGLSELDTRNPQAWEALVSSALYIGVTSDSEGKEGVFSSYEEAHELASNPGNIGFVNALFDGCTELNPDILK